MRSLRPIYPPLTPAGKIGPVEFVLSCMPAHADQRFVPNSYLKAWCDPDVPSEHTPYVWRFSKDGTEARKKAPKNIFTETDLYTITLRTGRAT